MHLFSGLLPPSKYLGAAGNIMLSWVLESRRYGFKYEDKKDTSEGSEDTTRRFAASRRTKTFIITGSHLLLVIPSYSKHCLRTVCVSVRVRPCPRYNIADTPLSVECGAPGAPGAPVSQYTALNNVPL